MKEPPRDDHPEFCNGCCQRHTCEHDLEQCCYLVKKECMLSQ